MSEKIPFVDLITQYNLIKNEIDTIINEVISSASFIRGTYVQQLENSFASMCGVEHCLGVGNGTDALHIALKCLGIKRGDEVLTSAHSWISTPESVSITGAKPVFVDIEPDYYTIDPSLIEQKITKDTKAILPVHIYGQPADMDPIRDICEDRNLFLIEDCAQAHFAEYHGKKVGNLGDVGTFSFYPSKNLGAYGDGGCITCNDSKLAEKMRRYANHGSLKKHDHLFEGINSRLDGIQAAVLLVKMRYVERWNAKRQMIADEYKLKLQNLSEISVPKIRDKSSHVFHVYAVEADKRDNLAMFLEEKGIQTAIHYPKFLPFVTAYSGMNNNKDDFPVSWKFQNRTLSLPMYPEMMSEQVEVVCKAIQSYYDC
ncbi:DegT/DnrJ/EryC1/StrS family aminotransferase [Methanospirillum lacunae]|uniref:Erythromycin biosynthesis sensory transduction protein eryC1 n=1 Tax=Methanospirillum lacunae TaxID=668570 RepID=A0A2V2NC10_9EURY|nr:DegT/DnrJ/EryC1/StrS family aminotransferase [Methanospirillum lacunae]PWR72843.1 erythromycin biosynthesis sensory transduction protein eryC1 [Methanospirillum lacunae]